MNCISIYSLLQELPKNKKNNVMECKNIHLVRIDPYPNLRSLFHGCDIRFGSNVEFV